jgi:hypothetical protein
MKYYARYKHLVLKVNTEMAADANCRLANHQSILFLDLIFVRLRAYIKFRQYADFIMCLFS